jgi:hypothetical protein
VSIAADNREVLAEFARLEYRQLVLQHSDLPASWRNLGWLDRAACRYVLTPDHGMCEACPVVKDCLAAALLVDDEARLRAGLDQSERAELWTVLEAFAQQIEPWIGELPAAAVW